MASLSATLTSDALALSGSGLLGSTGAGRLNCGHPGLCIVPKLFRCNEYFVHVACVQHFNQAQKNTSV